jgi:hypothetical protein
MYNYRVHVEASQRREVKQAIMVHRPHLFVLACNACVVASSPACMLAGADIQGMLCPNDSQRGKNFSLGHSLPRPVRQRLLDQMA